MQVRNTQTNNLAWPLAARQADRSYIEIKPPPLPRTESDDIRICYDLSANAWFEVDGGVSMPPALRNMRPSAAVCPSLMVAPMTMRPEQDNCMR